MLKGLGIILGPLLFITLIVLTINWKLSVWRECRKEHSRSYCFSLVGR